MNGYATTKQAAAKKLIAAGYNCSVTDTGLYVWGDGWSATYGDRGQDHNGYIGNVPEEVELLAVWDNETTRDQ